MAGNIEKVVIVIGYQRRCIRMVQDSAEINVDNQKFQREPQ